jgi:LuxR family maltose regulon positive regulatory protein
LAYLVPERDREPFIYNIPSMLRPPMVFMLAMTQRLLGQSESAVAGFLDAADSAQRQDNIHIVALALGQLGHLQITLGRLRDAEATFQRALGLAAQYGRGISAYFGISYVGLGILAYERGDFETARREIEEGVRLGKLWNSLETQLPGLSALIQLKLVSGDLPGAEKFLEDLAEVCAANPAQGTGLCESWQAEIWLRQGRLVDAANWAQSVIASLQKPALPAAVESITAVARVWLAQGKSELAVDLLTDQSARLDRAGQVSARLRLDALRVLALAAAGRGGEGLLALEAVVRQGQAEGYLRTIADAGPAIAGLLKRVSEEPLQRSPAERDYCLSLLAALSPAQPARVAEAISQPAELVEPLSPRELELLSLLASQASNAEIAEKSFITLNTLKKHITNIYGKLGVASRAQAIQRARQLKLL